MSNRLSNLFKDKTHRILNVYFTAGYPGRNDTMTIAKALDKSGADIIEIGIPFSDPVADGPTIQDSNQVALANGMTLKLLFEQLTNLRNHINIPVVLMGYYNPIMQYGIEEFCNKCNKIGIDGLIIPDLPMDIYERDHLSTFQKNNLSNIFLITPQTSNQRISKIDKLSSSFIYMVSSSSVTGKVGNLSIDQIDYFHRIKDIELTSPTLIGFGISNKTSFDTACQYANGAIIGSAFIKILGTSSALEKDIEDFCEGFILT